MISNKKLMSKKLNQRRSPWRKIIQAREMSVFAAFICICLVMSFSSPYFLNSQNIFNILRGMATTGIIAIGQTMVILTGGIDLSVGSVMAMSAILPARLMFFGYNPLLAFIAGLGIGFLAGMINGFIIAKAKITPLITTLGMLSMARGVTYLLATGVKGMAVASNIPIENKTINFIGSGYIGPVPFPVILMAILVIIFTLFLHYTALGLHIYAVGSNETAAGLFGININMVRLFVYSCTGFLCALAGIMQAGMLYTASTNVGLGKELDVIAAVVMGGASLTGGVGTIYGALIVGCWSRQITVQAYDTNSIVTV
jgi:ribose transport system permease protein